jgi:hypothetical protein|nr:MAG TPA: hypothetical protein [Bacteriophage sp.]
MYILSNIYVLRKKWNIFLKKDYSNIYGLSTIFILTETYPLPISLLSLLPVFNGLREIERRRRQKRESHKRAARG